MKKTPARDLMPRAEVLRCLRKYRYDPAYSENMNKRVVPINCVVHLARLGDRGRSVVNDCIAGHYMTARVWRALAPVIRDIEAGRVAFVRNTRDAQGRWPKGEQLWQVEYRQPPSGPVPRIEKLSRSADWKPFAVCRSCGGRRWEGVVIRGARHYACLSCAPPDTWPAMGGRRPDAIERLEMSQQTMLEDFSLV
jgi:hypothetical protein